MDLYHTFKNSICLSFDHYVYINESTAYMQFIIIIIIIELFIIHSD